MNVDRWKVLGLFRESVLNVINPRSRMVVTLVVAIAFGSAAVSFYAYESKQFADRLSELESQGSNVVVFQSSKPGVEIQISRKSCEALADIPGVTRSGLLIDEGTRNLPEVGANISLFAASTSLFPQLSQSDGLIGVSLAIGQLERTVTFGKSDTRRLSVAQRQPEGIPTNTAIVLPLAIGATAGPHCLVELARFQKSRSDIPVLESQLVVQGGSVIGRSQLTPPTDPVVDWTNRPGQFIGMALGAIGGLLATMLVWTRSSELAAYRLSGTSRRSLALMLTIESLLAAGMFGFSGTLAACVLDHFVISPHEVLLWSITGSATWYLATLPGTMRSIATSPATLTRR